MGTDISQNHDSPEQKIAEKISVSPWLRSLLFVVFLGVLSVFWGWMFGWFSLSVPDFNDFKPFANDRALVNNEVNTSSEKQNKLSAAEKRSEENGIPKVVTAIQEKPLVVNKVTAPVVAKENDVKAMSTVQPANPLQFNTAPAIAAPKQQVVKPVSPNVKPEPIHAIISFKEGNNKLTGDVRKQLENVADANSLQAATQISVRGYSDQSVTDPEVRRQSAIDRAVNVRTLIAKQYDIPVEKIRIFYDPNLTSKSSVVEIKTEIE